jgi:murein DD-endopeptidase MepM/ murein hydrolase activator NlpD
MRAYIHKIATLSLILIVASSAQSVFSATIDELRTRIQDGNQKIEELTKEIESLSSQLTLTAKQSQTLANTLKQLDLTKKKLAADIALTSKRIESTGATIEELVQNIDKTESSIDTSTHIIADTIRLIATKESESLIENLLKHPTISDAWDYVSTLADVEGDMRLRLLDLKDEKADLSVKKDTLVGQKKNLEGYQKNLSDQKKVADYNALETNRLLKLKQDEKAFQEREIALKNAQKDAFERELFDYESQLQIAIDPSSIPAERRGVLSWPLDKVYITQYFGKTSASKRLYTSGTHNGIDFRAVTGTPVKATLSGVIQATGNTDIVYGCASYGRWILIRHANGLSSLYGHLSVISVKAGDTVVTGDRIGYSGNTGYSTGPHLHLTVLASQGVRVEKFANSKNCKNVVLPLADIKAYLDPSAYLPR